MNSVRQNTTLSNGSLLKFNMKTKNPVGTLDVHYPRFASVLSQSRRLPLLQVISNNKSFSVGVQSPTEINAPRGCAVILRRICQLSLTRITHQVSRAFDLNALALTPEKEVVPARTKLAKLSRSLNRLP